jgi:hypothetical protein
VRKLKLSEAEIIRLLFTAIENFQKYSQVYGDEKSARYAAVCQTFAALKDCGPTPKPARPSIEVRDILTEDFLPLASDS